MGMQLCYECEKKQDVDKAGTLFSSGLLPDH